MKKKLILGMVLSISVSAILVFLNHSFEDESLVLSHSSITHSSRIDLPAVVETNVLLEQKENVNTFMMPADDASEQEPTENPFFEAETKARLIQIADTFADDIQFPDYSKPIRHQGELQKYLPNQSVASSLSLDSKKENSPRISLKTSKYQYFRGETIIGDAMVEGLTGSEKVSVAARLVSLGKVLAVADAHAANNTTQHFQLAFNSENISINNETGELRLIASFSIEQRQYEIGTPIQYVDSVASVDYVADAQVNDVFLEIPIYITSYQPGFHQISANLYNADTGQALIHLSAEKELLIENDFIVLKAHIASLKAAKHEGPYVLKDISLTRMPSPPNFATEFGTVPEEGVSLSGFSFDNYRDEPYVDEDAQRRLEFLSKLGG